MSANGIASILQCFVVLKNVAAENNREIVKFRVSPKYYGEILQTGVADTQWNKKPTNIDSLMKVTLFGILIEKDHTVSGIEAILE